MSNINIKNSYDIVVIGAGVGGLTAAALLSKAGYTVAVVEMASQAGGYLAGFHRHKFRFDTAIHWLNQCNPGGIVNTVFETIGTDYPHAIPQKRIKRYRGDHHDYLLTNNPDELKAQLQSEYPHEKAGIERFFKDAKVLGERMYKWGSNVRSSETLKWYEKASNGFKMLRFVLPFIQHVRFSGEEGLEKGWTDILKKKITPIF